MHNTFAALVIGIVVAAVAGITARLDAQHETGTVKQIMLTMTIPASDAIFSAASESPTSARQWAELRTHALTLAESGTLLMTGGRAKDTAAWVDMARELVTRAQATLKVIDAKDGDALAEAGDGVYMTCETCHERYLDK